MSQFGLRQTPDDLDNAVDSAINRTGSDLQLAIRDLARRQHEFEGVIAKSASVVHPRRGLPR